MKHAIARLEISLAAVEHNAPIHEAAGDLEQAQLDRESAASYRAAIALLSA